MSGIGPVEPAGPVEAHTGDAPATPQDAPPPDVIGTDSPRLTDRWHALLPRTRATALAAAAATLAAAVWLLTAQLPATPPEEPTAPWPSTTTAFHYKGVADTPAATTRDFRFDVSVHDGPPVTISDITATPAGLHTRTTPPTTFTVRAGTTHRITVRITVTDCGGLPLNVNLPFLDVTLRNTQAIQHYSFIFGGSYSRDLSDLLHTACDATRALSSPRVQPEVRVLTMWTRHVSAKPAESELPQGSPSGTS
ncbi:MULTISPECIES: hypothetical protein [unclassified Streptomyces]|uniref:hypothetical protein n=1 Tax=unclassified Streptomyces TaxID=2593676 RepID=UPI00225717CD|nr:MULTISPECIES: hypothetical protein [unclassified Streptomyces]MCX5047440.1 hypothetical protein [Streptomyces sp. NBC_00474]